MPHRPGLAVDSSRVQVSRLNSHYVPGTGGVRETWTDAAAAWMKF